MGSIKDRNGMGLTEAEDIKKRWQEYTEELNKKRASRPRWQEYTKELNKKELHDPDNHDGVITHTHLEPDIMECEVKRALGSIITKLVEVIEFQLSYFKS